jgi:hypothetical protein
MELVIHIPFTGLLLLAMFSLFHLAANHKI